MRSALLLVAVFMVVGCKGKPEPTARVTLQRLTGNTFRLTPTEGQLPYCLAYTVSMNGITRQLTMSKANASFECTEGQPIGRHPFKVPVAEGPVKVYVLFTSQPVNAGSVSEQILEADNRQALKVMNMRLPGNAALETLDFVPEEESPAEVGRLLGADAGGPAPAEDAGVTEDAGAP